MDVTPCRSCNRLVKWARSFKTGKPMPLDIDPDGEKGNVLVDGSGRAHSFRDAAAALAYQDREDAHPELATSARFVSHHFTCPEGPRWRGVTRDDPAAPVQGSLL